MKRVISWGKCNAEEDEPILPSIDESPTYDESDDGSIIMKDIKDIQDRSQIYPDINTRDARLKICESIKQTQTEWKGSELWENSIGEILHKVFKAVVNEINNALPTLVESGSEVSHFITEPRYFSEVFRLTVDFKKGLVGSNFERDQKNYQQSDLSNGWPREERSSDTMCRCLQVKDPIFGIVVRGDWFIH